MPKPQRLLLFLLSALAITCGKKPTGTPPERYCPGGPGCERGGDGALSVGVSAKKITPVAYELPRPDFLREVGSCSEGTPLGSDGKPHCGKLIAEAWDDCGLDKICPGQASYTGPDTGERDGKADFFFDCGTDRVCPGDPGYTAADANGTEGDGKFQGIWLAGFGTSRPMGGIHDDIWARAVVFKSGDVTIAIVALDVVGFFHDDAQRIRARVAEVGGSDIDYVLVHSTHNHQGPDTEGQWGPATTGLIPDRGVDEAWMTNVVIANAADAVIEASKSARAAKLYAAQGHLGTELVKQIVQDHRDPTVVDDTITAMKFVDAESGLAIGSLVSMGNHAETLADTNQMLTSDFPWALREAMENGVAPSDGTATLEGLGGVSIFLNGPMGGMMSTLRAKPIALDGTMPASRTFAKAKAIGDRLAQFSLKLLANAPEASSPVLGFGAQTVRLYADNEVMRFAALRNVLKRKIYDYDESKPFSESNTPRVQSEVMKLDVGPVRFLGLPGEPFPELGIGYDPQWAFGEPQLKVDNPDPPNLAAAPSAPYLKEQLGGQLPVIVGLANDHVGYLIPSYDFKLDPSVPYWEEPDGDHYEETNSLGPRTVPDVLDACQKLFAWQPF